MERRRELLDRIGALADAVFERAVLGFRGLLQAAAGAVELPAVIRAADAFGVDAAVSERGAAVRAALGHETVAAGLVAKHD